VAGFSERSGEVWAARDLQVGDASILKGVGNAAAKVAAIFSYSHTM
jgi:hypothetical protein